MHWWNDGWSWWNWTLMTIAMIGFWGLVIGVFVALARSPDRLPGGTRRSPEQILAERFAAGEIDLHSRRNSRAPSRPSSATQPFNVLRRSLTSRRWSPAASVDQLRCPSHPSFPA